MTNDESPSTFGGVLVLFGDVPNTPEGARLIDECGQEIARRFNADGDANVGRLLTFVWDPAKQADAAELAEHIAGVIRDPAGGDDGPEKDWLVRRSKAESYARLGINPLGKGRRGSA